MFDTVLVTGSGTPIRVAVVSGADNATVLVAPFDPFGGDFTVPSYRGSSFLDPKGRGGSTGYDNAVALPARSDADELQKENNKSVVALRGQAVFSVAKVDPATGEIAGVFESVQPSDTDLGSKAPKDIKITGLWYGQLTQ